jgi:4-hydroxy-tetrahydrodipicolinate synthase
MKKEIFRGAGVAIITPMHADGTVNYEKLGEMIEFQIKGGTDAVLICGTTGESPTLSHEEHAKAIQYTVNKVAHRIPVIAGTGSNDTLTALKLSQEAEKAGVDALLLVTPFYNKTTQSGLVRHFEYIADRVNTPIILYNIPSRTGVEIKPATFKELSKHPNIVADKEASGNISAAARTMALCGDDLTVYSGNDSETVPLMSLGGKGVISVLSNIMPKETHDICAKFFAGDIEGARRLQLDLMGLIDALFIEVNPMPIKAAMNMMGMDVGECRMPLTSLMPANAEVLRNELIRHGLLKA